MVQLLTNRKFDVSDSLDSESSQAVTHGEEVFAFADAVEIPPAEGQRIEVLVDRAEQRLCRLQPVWSRAEVTVSARMLARRACLRTSG